MRPRSGSKSRRQVSLDDMGRGEEVSDQQVQQYMYSSTCTSSRYCSRLICSDACQIHGDPALNLTR